MPRGGARPGAGRKPGSAAVEVEKLRRVTRARLTELLKGGKDPLDVLIAVAFDDSVDVSLRVMAAAQACPYMHPRLSQQSINSTSLHAQVNQQEVLAALTARLDRLAAPGPTLDGVAEVVRGPAEVQA